MSIRENWTHLCAQGLGNIIQTWEDCQVHLGQDTGHLTKQLSCQEGLKATAETWHSVSPSSNAPAPLRRPDPSLTAVQNISAVLLEARANGSIRNGVVLSPAAP